ncbi:hypothetical protein UT300012_23390 [Paraclostridium bifermentans]
MTNDKIDGVVMFVNFAKSLKDVEILALSEIEGELPQRLNRLLLDFRFELRTKDSSRKFIEESLTTIRNYDLVMGYVYFVEQVHVLRDSVTGKDEYGLDLVIGYTLLANTCLLLLNVRSNLIVGTPVACDVNKESKDIEFVTEVNIEQYAILQDPYDIYYIGKASGTISTLLDSLTYKDLLLNLVLTGDAVVYKPNKTLEVRRVKTYKDSKGVFDKKTVIGLDNDAYRKLLPNVLFFKIQRVKVYGMEYLMVETTDNNLNVWNLNIPQYGDYGYCIGNNILAYMTVIKNILKGDIEGLTLV